MQSASPKDRVSLASRNDPGERRVPEGSDFWELTPEMVRAAKQGKQAATPTRFAWRDWMDVLRRVAGDIGRHHLSVLSAGVAFFAMLALFPAIAALIGLYGLVANPRDVSDHLDQIEPLLPADAYGIIAGQVEAVTSAGSGKLGLASAIGILLALWSTRAAVAALMDGLNIVYEEEDDRSIVRFTAPRSG